MRVSKTEKTCPICGTAFTLKTINSRYCSKQCSRKAYKRKVAEEKQQQELDAIAITKHIRKYRIPMRHQGNSIYVPKT